MACNQDAEFRAGAVRLFSTAANIAVLLYRNFTEKLDANALLLIGWAQAPPFSIDPGC